MIIKALNLLFILAKRSILDVWERSEYTCDILPNVLELGHHIYTVKVFFWSLSHCFLAVCFIYIFKLENESNSLFWNLFI